MKWSITIWITVVLLSSGLVHAQQPQRLMNCADWTEIWAGEVGVVAKTFYLSGFLHGATAMAALSEANEQRRVELVTKNVWAAGLNHAQMLALVNEYCGRPENKSLTIMESVVKITRQINGTTPPSAAPR